MIIFSEPVQLISCSGISILSQDLNVSFRNCDPDYFDFGTKFRFNFLDTEFENISTKDVVELLSKTPPGKLWLTIQNASVVDVVSVKNYMSSWKLEESSPGMIDMSSLVYHSR